MVLSPRNKTCSGPSHFLIIPRSITAAADARSSDGLIDTRPVAMRVFLDSDQAPLTNVPNTRIPHPNAKEAEVAEEKPCVMWNANCRRCTISAHRSCITSSAMEAISFAISIVSRARSARH